MIPTILVSVAYVAAQMLADVASLRVVMFAGMSMDAGTLVYPLTFTLRDMVHKVAGVKATRVLTLAAAGINVVMAGLFWLVSVMEPDMSGRHEVKFIDNDYFNYQHDIHLQAVSELKPKYATVRDAMTHAQCNAAEIEYYSLEQLS